MSFGEFYTAFSGLGDAFKEGADKAEAARLLDQQLTAALGTQQTQAAQPAALAALGQSPVATPKVPTFAATGGGGMGDYLSTLRGKESGGNSFAKNPNSSATGIDQFTSGTWAGLMRKYPQLGLTANGRTDPEQSTRAMQAFTQDNASALSKAGVPITPGNLYVSHFLGEAGGPRFIAGALTNPDAPATAFVTPGAAAANRTIFFNRDGTPKRAGEVYAERTSRFGGGEPTVPTRVASAGDATAMPPMGMPQGAPRVMPQQVAQAGDNPADLPAPNAQPVEFRIPGQEQPSDFVPGTVASPAVQGGNPQIAAGGQALAPAAAQRLSPDQVTNLRAMLRNPNTQGYAAKIIEGLNKPSEFSFQVVGDQLIRTSKDGRAEVVPNITKPPTFDTVKDDNGNIQVFNKATGQITRGLPGQDKSVRDLTPAEKQARGIEANVFAQVDANGNVMFPGKPANVVNLDQKQEGAFAGEAGKGIASRFQKISDEGDAGRTELALVGQLKSLADQIGTGAGAAATARLAEYGVKVGPNVGKIEAYQSLVDKLTPSQRLPGAGATSDFDAKLFKSSLPRLINTPEGNALISSTLEALAKDKVSRAEIADMALIGPSQGGISTAEAVKRLRALPPPNLVLQSGLTELQKAGKLAPAAPDAGGGANAKLKSMDGGLIAEARAAIQAGKPAAAVMQRLRENGYDPSGL